MAEISRMQPPQLTRQVRKRLIELLSDEQLPGAALMRRLRKRACEILEFRLAGKVDKAERLESDLRARLLGRDPGRPPQSLRSRPLRLGRLSAELRHRGFAVRRWRFTEFLFFPLDRLAPVWSRRLADLLEPWGGVPILSRLGAQILVEAGRPPAPPAAA